ncbi:hypothetical protein ACFX2F_038890 [Malus domestica]
MLEIRLRTGSLTNVLINAGAFVLAIKKDPHMATHVSERFAETDRFKVLKEDFVKCRIHSYVVSLLACAEPSCSVLILQNMNYQGSTLEKVIWVEIVKMDISGMPVDSTAMS